MTPAIEKPATVSVIGPLRSLSCAILLARRSASLIVDWILSCNWASMVKALTMAMP